MQLFQLMFRSKGASIRSFLLVRILVAVFLYKLLNYCEKTVWIRYSYISALYLDPCDRIICNGANAVCEMIFATGDPICVCPEGMKGDPEIGCGN